MLESIVAWVLNNYIGEYLQLNTDQFSIAFLQGQVDLTNVPIKKQALRKFDIPIQVKNGIIGKLQLQVPLLSRSSPWVLKIADFLVVLGPCNIGYDVKCVEQYRQQKQEQMLDEIEQQHKKQLLAQIGIQFTEDVGQETGHWWGASLLSTISNNIQVQIENIQIKYECMEYEFGIKIQSLAIETTNAQWRPGFIEVSEGANIFKKFDIKGFSIHWNPVPRKDNNFAGKLLGMSLAAIKEELKKNFANHQNGQTNYILQPLSLDMRIEKNSSRHPLRTNVPRFKIDIRSRKIELELNKQQIQQIQQFSENWVLFERARPHRKWRPILAVLDSPKEWWRFAIGRVLDEIHSRNYNFRSAKLLCARLKLLNAYSRAYQCRLKCYLEGKLKKANPNASIFIPKLSLPDTAKTENTTTLIKQIEHGDDFSYQDLRILREAVYNKLSQELKNIEEEDAENHSLKGDDSPFEIIPTTSSRNNEKEHPLTKNIEKDNSNIHQGQGWLNWMTSLLQGQTLEESTKQEEDFNEAIYLNLRPLSLDKHSLSPELEEIERRMEAELLQVLNESFEDSNILRRDNLLAELVLNFSHVFLRISKEKRSKPDKINENGERTTMITFDFDKVCSRIQLSPKEHRIELSLTVKDLSVQQIQFQSYARMTGGNTCSSSASEQGQITPNKNSYDIIAQEDEVLSDNALEIDSLACGFHNNLKTRLLLTVGRIYDEEEEPKEKRSRKRKNKKSFTEQKRDNCILKLFYKRLAPKLEVYNELNMICAPLSIVADELALNRILDIFDSNENDGDVEQQQQKEVNNDFNPLPETIVNQIFASFTCPELIIELRSQKAANNCLFSPHFGHNSTSKKNSMENEGSCGLGLDETPATDSITFARAIIQKPYLTLTQHSGCNHLAKMDLTFDSFLLEDLFENQAEWPLLRIVELHSYQEIENQTLSTSCPANLNSLSVMDDLYSTTNLSAMNNLNFTTMRKRGNSDKESDYAKIDNNVVHQKLGNLNYNSNCGGTNTHTKMLLSRMHTLKFIFIPKEHPDWATHYKKANCKIVGHFNDQQTNVELNINRRSLTLLFDFFGLTSITPEIGKTSSKLESYLVNIELSAANLLLAMNFPQNKTQLSICKIQRPKLDIQVDLNIIDNPHIVSFSAHSLSLIDLTPIYGRVYNEILKIESKRETLEKPSIHLNLLKNSDASMIFTREFDILLALEIDTPTHYIHTQRFFYALMDFWLQFAELFDKVTLYNAREMDKKMQDSMKLFSSHQLLKTRCQLNLELQDRLNLYIPQHHCSSQSILFTCDKIQGNNTFIWASSLATMLNQQQLIQIQQQQHPQLNRSQSSSSTKLLTDCLLDAMNLLCHNLSVNYGTFICLHRKNDSNANLLAGRSFSEYSYQTNSSQTVMEANGSILVLDIYRNLSAAISHNVPALFILFRLQNATIKFTSDFYKLFRGCMDQNIGEQIVPQVWTFPLELLELPEIISPLEGLERSEKYSTFSMRVSLKKVLINLSTPISPIELTKFEEFAKLHIRSGKLTYDSFADSQAEFDFICENASMEDSRPPESCKNVSESFKKVLKMRSSNFIGVTRKDSMENINESFGNTTTTNISPKHFSDDRKLLFEFHIQMRKNDCPVFSMIFIRTRIYLLMDWIRQLQTFLLLYSEFKPPSEPSEKLLNDALLLQPSLIEMPKNGVLLRRISPSSTHHQQIPKASINSASFSTKEKEHSKMVDDTSGKFSMKITLKDCELIALENPSREDSFALIMLTTGVILSDNLKQVELVESQYEIQQFSLHWRSMRSESSCAQLTKDTNATISISYEDEHKLDLLNPAGNGNKIEANQPFLLNKRLHLPSQIIHCQIGQPLIFRGSLKDYFIVKQIYDAAYTFWENSQEIDFFWANSSAMQTLDSFFPVEFIPSEKTLKSNSQNQQKFILNVDNLCIKIFKEATMTNQLKDCSWESMAPFLKININGMNLTSTLFTTKIRLMLGIDYYRHMNAPLGLGWEPVLENCQITDFIAIFVEKSNTWNLKLKPAENCVMELNLTQSFIQEFIDFQSEDIASISDILNAPGNEGLEKLRNELYSSKNADDINDESCSSKASDYIPAKLTKNFGDGNYLYSNLLTKKIIDPKQQFTNPGINIDLQLELDAGIGVSVIGNDEQIEGNDGQQQQEELIYARFSGFQANLQKRKHIYQLSCCINSIRMDNQIFGADRFHFFFCDPSALHAEPLAGPLPALNFEMSYTCSEFWDAYESFRLKLCNSCILLDEQLLWRLINFGINIYSHRVQKDGQQKQMEKELRNCYFGVFQLELGEISLSVMTIDKNILPPKLRSLKENYSDKLVLFSFENALVNLAPFWAHRCYTTLGNLFANVGDFYIEELKRQKLNIVVAMDAFGNPIAFANDFKEGVEGLLFEGDLAGFTFGIGYGAANSISKLASSMAQGVGSLTFDDKHEQFRRKMIRSSKPDESNAFTHLYGGLKGFGVGVFGGLRAIPKNTMTATKQDGFTGVFRGVTTGAIDTLTKPIQGALDLVEGTASALKEIVGAPLVRRAHFPKNRLRLPRVCSSLNGLLPQFSNELAVGQQELLRITGMFTLNDENRLLCIVPFLERFNADKTRRFVLQRALICLHRCYIIRDVDDQTTSMVIYRILFQNLRKVQLANQEQLQQSSQNRPSTSTNRAENKNNSGISTRLAAVEVFYHPTTSKEHMKTSASSSNFYLRSSAKPNQQQIMATQTPALTLWCTDLEKAQLLCRQLMNAKAQFDQRGFGKRIRATPSTTSSKKNSSIFTI